MPFIFSRDMGTLATPMGPCDVSIFFMFLLISILNYFLILTMHFFNLLMHA